MLLLDDFGRAPYIPQPYIEIRWIYYTTIVAKRPLPTVDRSINIYAFTLQLPSCNLNLLHELPMRLWYIIEGDNAPAKLE